MKHSLGTVDLADVIKTCLTQAGYNVCQVARLSGVPRRTIANWREGVVKKPRVWQDVVKVGRALRLTPEEANQLLQAAGQPTLTQLRQQAQSEAEQALLAFWLSAPPLPLAPFQAIPDLPTFVGRGAEQESLQQWLIADYQPSPIVIEGMAGVGKTVLAARSAYQLRSHFSDGVLWLRPDLTDPMTGLQLLAEAYGVAVAAYGDSGSRSQMVRGLLANKRALLVLDNVISEEAIRPLLPPSGRCAVLITTRRHDLTVAADKRLTLHGFEAEPTATLALFRQFFGAEQVAAEEEVLLELGDWVGHLPLALDIIASRLAYEPGWTAAAFWARLCRAQNGLATLSFAERRLETVLAASYAALTGQQQQFFVALATFAGTPFSVQAAAMAAKVSEAEADTLLKTLFCLSFVRRGFTNGYRLPPVLQAFAARKRAEQAKEFDKELVMAASKSYRDYVLGELGKVTAVRARAMFGGYGIYADDVMFGLISSDDVLYLKIDDTSRAKYEALEMPQFMTMPYFQLPIDILEDDEQLAAWVKTAVSVAIRTKKPKKKKR